MRRAPALRIELGVVFLFIVGLRIVAYFINPESARWMDHILVYVPISLYVLASDGAECLLIAFVIFVSGDHPSMFGLRWPRVLPDTIWALIALALGWIVWALVDLIPQPDWILPEDALPSFKDRPVEVLVGSLSLFIGAATEEFLFRGYFLARFTEVTRSIAGGVLLSSFAFGMLHMYQGPAGVLSASLLGVVFSLVVVATKSIWPTAIAHFLMNAWWYHLID